MSKRSSDIPFSPVEFNPWRPSGSAEMEIFRETTNLANSIAVHALAPCVAT